MFKIRLTWGQNFVMLLHPGRASTFRYSASAAVRICPRTAGSAACTSCRQRRHAMRLRVLQSRAQATAERDNSITPHSWANCSQSDCQRQGYFTTLHSCQPQQQADRPMLHDLKQLLLHSCCSPALPQQLQSTGSNALHTLQQRPHRQGFLRPAQRDTTVRGDSLTDMTRSFEGAATHRGKAAAPALLQVQPQHLAEGSTWRSSAAAARSRQQLPLPRQAYTPAAARRPG